MNESARQAVGLSVTGLVKRYRDRGHLVTAADGVTFEVAAGMFFALLGPSGCGKTTTLRCIAGFERNEAGSVSIGTAVVSDGERNLFLPANRRDIGMVFQSYGIWPHMTVFENAAFPLRVARVGSEEIRRRVGEVLDNVQLGGFAGRNATQLSGGQQQRLALARALVRRPQVLLLDEPLSNLDAQLREAMRSEVRDIQRRLGITTVYVTHDQTEALSMADRVALLCDGKIVQQGPPREIYERPATRFAADFVGKTNFVDGTVVSHRGGTAVVATPMGNVCATANGTSPSAVTVCIRPEYVDLLSAPSAGENVFEGELERVTFLGEFAEVVIAVAGCRLRARGTPRSDMRPGDRVRVRLPVERCLLLS